MLIATMTYSTKHQEGRSALSLALERGDVELMKDLIERGADVNTQNEVIMYRDLATLRSSCVRTMVCTHVKRV